MDDEVGSGPYVPLGLPPLRAGNVPEDGRRRPSGGGWGGSGGNRRGTSGSGGGGGGGSVGGAGGPSMGSGSGCPIHLSPKHDPVLPPQPTSRQPALSSSSTASVPIPGRSIRHPSARRSAGTPPAWGVASSSGGGDAPRGSSSSLPTSGGVNHGQVGVRVVGAATRGIVTASGPLSAFEASMEGGAGNAATTPPPSVGSAAAGGLSGHSHAVGGGGARRMSSGTPAAAGPAIRGISPPARPHSAMSLGEAQPPTHGGGRNPGISVHHLPPASNHQPPTAVNHHMSAAPTPTWAQRLNTFPLPSAWVGGAGFPGGSSSASSSRRESVSPERFPTESRRASSTMSHVSDN